MTRASSSLSAAVLMVTVVPPMPKSMTHVAKATVVTMMMAKNKWNERHHIAAMMGVSPVMYLLHQARITFGESVGPNS